MREIKYRGKRVDTGEWVYGNLCVFGTTYEIIPMVGIGPVQSKKVIPETVGQYIGLKDKNGKEIWEGGVISDTSWGVPCKSYIVYNQDICAFQTKYQNFDGLWVTNTIYSTDCKKMEVIGNIHDNPELLKDGTA